MDNIIFLDIDGVLNDINTFINNKNIKDVYNKVLKYYKNNNYLKYLELLIDKVMLDIDYEKLELLKYVVSSTNAKIVITSSWKCLDHYSLIEERLINIGLPIIDTIENIYDRGVGIKQYLIEHNIKNYVVIDDSVFPGYDEELKYHLVLTNYYVDGYKNELADYTIHKLNLKK